MNPPLRFVLGCAWALPIFVAACTTDDTTASAQASECAAHGAELAQMIAATAPVTDKPPSADCLARAGSLWLAEHHLRVLTLAAKGERQLVARDPAMAAAAAAAGRERDDAAAALAAERRRAVAAGCTALAAGDGARALLAAHVLGDMHARAQATAHACQSAPAKLAVGDVVNLVGSYGVVLPDIQGAEHDLVLRSVAQSLAKGGAR